MKKYILFTLFMLLTISFNAQVKEIFFKRPVTWGNVTPKIYVYNTPYNSSSAWPGVSMRATCDPNWFVFLPIGSPTNVYFSFSNGSTGIGNQSQELSSNIPINYYEFNSSETTNPVFASSTTPIIPNPCVVMSPQSGTFYTGTNVNVLLGSKSYTNVTPTIYYTLDGTEPTTSSSSVQYGTATYSSGNNMIKAFAKLPDGSTSTIESRYYNFTTDGITVTFILDDPTLTGWSGIIPYINYWNVLTPTENPAIDNSSWPGVKMSATGTSNKYTYFFPYATSVNFAFNNGSTGLGNQTSEILNITNNVVYHYPSGILSTNDLKSSKKIEIYPNPVSTILKIKSDKQPTKYAIYDAAGNLVEQKNLSSNEVNVQKLPSGIYYIKLLLENKKIVFEQFIKK